MIRYSRLALFLDALFLDLADGKTFQQVVVVTPLLLHSSSSIHFPSAKMKKQRRTQETARVSLPYLWMDSSQVRANQASARQVRQGWSPLSAAALAIIERKFRLLCRQPAT